MMFWMHFQIDFKRMLDYLRAQLIGCQAGLCGYSNNLIYVPMVSNCAMGQSALHMCLTEQP